MLGVKLLNRIKLLLSRGYAKLRVLKFKCLSLNSPIGRYKCWQPIHTLGKGKIQFNNVSFGVEQSPYFFSGYGYFEARHAGSHIFIDENTFINNNAHIQAEQTTISIGKNCLIGVNFSCIDSDFHGIEPNKRRGGFQFCKPVTIGENVFIGNNVTILKGVEIGMNSAVASNSVVTKSFPANVLIGGNPARVIREFSLT